MLNLSDNMCKINKLNISKEKTSGMLVKDKLSMTKPLWIKFQGTAIRIVNEHKYLGVVPDQTLSFKRHFRYLIEMCQHISWIKESYER